MGSLLLPGASRALCLRGCACSTVRLHRAACTEVLLPKQEAPAGNKQMHCQHQI